jgi:hypothetical protein
LAVFTDIAGNTFADGNVSRRLNPADASQNYA